MQAPFMRPDANNAMHLFGLFFAPFASTVAVLLIVLFAIRQ
jgi:hypothetical protein